MSDQSTTAPSPLDPTPPAPSAPPRAPTAPGPEDTAFWSREHPQHTERVQAVLQQLLDHHDEVLPRDLRPPPPSLVIPETLIPDGADRAGLEVLVQALGYDAAAGQGLVDFFTGLRDGTPADVAPSAYTLESGRRAALEARWGADVEPRLELARSVFAGFPEHVRDFLREAGWADTPEVVGYLAAAGARRRLRLTTDPAERRRLAAWTRPED
jgi:hypothetical protein